MLRKFVAVFLASLICQLAVAEETAEREWTSKVGTKITGRAIDLSDNKVTFITNKGREIKVSLNKLAVADQAYLKDFFMEGGTGASLALPKGEMKGPIKAGKGSSYFIYLPETFIGGGKAPLLFWTGSSESDAKTLDHWKKTADIIGIPLACSKEAKNGENPKSNADHTRDCLRHIAKTLPIDIKRTIFSGDSDGGVEALKNSGSLPSIGAIPFIARMPDEIELPKDGFYYFGNGAHDFNRYSAAAAVAKIGKNATHRFYPGGHTITGWEPAEDGLLWAYTRHLYLNREKYSAEADVFESRLVEWIKGLYTTKPHEATYWVDHLMNTCRVEGDFATTIDELFLEYSENEDNLRYLRGRQEVEKFSKRFFADHQKDAPTDDIKRAAARLKSEYEGVADLGQIFEDFSKPVK